MYCAILGWWFWLLRSPVLLRRVVADRQADRWMHEHRLHAAGRTQQHRATLLCRPSPTLLPTEHSSLTACRAQHSTAAAQFALPPTSSLHVCEGHSRAHACMLAVAAQEVDTEVAPARVQSQWLFDCCALSAGAFGALAPPSPACCVRACRCVDQACARSPPACVRVLPGVCTQCMMPAVAQGSAGGVAMSDTAQQDNACAASNASTACASPPAWRDTGRELRGVMPRQYRGAHRCSGCARGATPPLTHKHSTLRTTACVRTSQIVGSEAGSEDGVPHGGFEARDRHQGHMKCPSNTLTLVHNSNRPQHTRIPPTSARASNPRTVRNCTARWEAARQSVCFGLDAANPLRTRQGPGNDAGH
jgi:hypothetical protein